MITAYEQEFTSSSLFAASMMDSEKKHIFSFVNELADNIHDHVLAGHAGTYNSAMVVALMMENSIQEWTLCIESQKKGNAPQRLIKNTRKATLVVGHKKPKHADRKQCSCAAAMNTF